MYFESLEDFISKILNMAKKLFIGIFLLFALTFSSYYILYSSRKNPDIVAEVRSEFWQKISIQGLPIGYLVVRSKDKSIEENMNMFIKALGSSREVKTKLVWEKQSNLSMKSLIFELYTEGSRNVIKAYVKDKKMEIQVGESKKYFDLDSDVYTGTSYIFIISSLLKSKNFKSFELLYFDPSVLRLDKLKIKYEGKENGFIVLSKSFAGVNSKIYFSESGDFVREYGPAGITLEKSSYDSVISSLSKSDIDIIFSTSSKAYGNLPYIDDRRKISYVKLLIEGVEDIPSFFPFQKVSKETASGVTRIYVELEKSYLEQKDVPDMYVKPEPLIESDSKELKAVSEKITGSKRAEIAKNVSDWVYRNLEKASVLSMPSALEVLRTRKGDCNEHAILTVAILRSLGIPSRVAFGLVYDSGSFFYHAWVEFHDGDKWVSFDPTWGLFPADILRIKIGDGNVSEWVEVLKYVGKVKITFLEWKI